jgi:hypothetical protein
MMGSTCSPSARSASIIMCRASNARSDSGQGAQIYQCKADAEGGLAWVLREPIASLFLNDKTVGRHYAGPR